MKHDFGCYSGVTNALAQQFPDHPEVLELVNKFYKLPDTGKIIVEWNEKAYALFVRLGCEIK